MRKFEDQNPGMIAVYSVSLTISLLLSFFLIGYAIYQNTLLHWAVAIFSCTTTYFCHSSFYYYRQYLRFRDLYFHPWEDGRETDND